MMSSLASLKTVICSDPHDWHDTHDRLVNSTFSSYNTLTRPSSDGSATIVSVSLIPSFIHDLDEKSQTLRLTSTISLFWEDPRLSWQPPDYGGISTIHIPQSQLWLPPVHIENSIDARERFGYDENLVTIHPSGHVSWTVNQVISVRCNIKVSYYPFDVQKCSIREKKR